MEFPPTLRIRKAAALAAGMTACLAAPAWAGELAGVTLPEQTQVEGGTLVLNGMGLREATWLRIKVYVAGLYLEKQTSDAEEILHADRHPKRIVFVFVRSVGRKSIIKEWDESLAANLAEEAGAPLRNRFATLHALMPDTIKRGDEMTLTYLPGKGVVVEIQGVTRGTIPGADFARALFVLWLGAKPPNQSLKAGLLGRG